MMMITWLKERVYSPADPTANIIGKNANMVVNEEVSNGTARLRPAAAQATKRSTPVSKRRRISSATTMPLSTSKPRAMIIAAI
jgi:hypothetical protein